MHAVQVGVSGLFGGFPEQLAGACPIRCGNVFENHVDVAGIGTGVFNDAFGDIGCNSIPSRTLIWEGCAKCTVVLLESIVLLNTVAINGLQL
jgi:hypothetical protein